jgi:diphosphate--fructose-6-phosphate 1-phosphotransferase
MESLDIGIVVIGGDDSNTNGAVLAEYFEAHNCKTKVCGAPKTIDGDLKVDPYIPISFGFDTACRTYSELIGNLGQDTLSSQKYYHFVRLMGRAASNIALECALQTRPNVCLISEEIEAKQMTLAQITKEVVDVILARSAQGKDYGLVLLPEGLIEFIPEFNQLISEINDVLAKGVDTTEAAVTPFLSANNKAVFAYLPENIKQQLLLDRDPHGNVQVAKIETERLLAQTVSMELESLRTTGKYKGQFTPIYHSYGYEGRSGLPSSFDATYCYVLGQNVGAMLSLGCNGLISSVTNLHAPVAEWKCGGVPITMMCHMEKRHGHMKPVIKKALVELDGEPFKCFAAQRADWAIYDLYRSPGPIQYFSGSGSVELCITLTLELLKSDPRMSTADIESAKELQKKSTRCGNYLFSPVTGAAKGILSVAQKERATFKPILCATLSKTGGGGVCEARQATQCRRVADKAIMKSKFKHTYGSNLVTIEPSANLALATRPLKVGVAFCGRQAPGGHDVISGLFDSLPQGSVLVGFIGGTVGLVGNHGITITADQLTAYRGGGGSELLCRSIENIDSLDFAGIGSTCSARGLDGLVLVGGARTNTVAAYLAEFLVNSKCATKIITTPVDCTGAFRNEFVETTVGFNTCTKVAGQIVGNNATDGASAKKYYYFMRLLGSSPSHSTLEVALITKPNFVILAEEVVAHNMTLVRRN